MERASLMAGWPEEQKRYLVNSLIRSCIDQGEREGLQLEPYFAYFADVLAGKVEDLLAGIPDMTPLFAGSADLVSQYSEHQVQALVSDAMSRVSTKLPPSAQIYGLVEFAGALALTIKEQEPDEFINLFSEQLLYADLVLSPRALA